MNDELSQEGLSNSPEEIRFRNLASIRFGYFRCAR